MAAESTSPLHQFVIERLVPLHLGGLDISYSNSALAMTVVVALITAFLVFSMSGAGLVPSRIQSVAELCYEFIANMVRDNVGSAGRPYFPFIFSLFLFVLFGNLIGMVPYSFTYTSHIAVTAGLAIMVIIIVTAVALRIHGLHFFSYFVPEGSPKLLMPLIVPVEIISYLSRPVSLSIRLFANMVAGHVMFEVFATFVVLIGGIG
ncbi:MAG: F0F1 ATP synthase subunit A, partial [Alphaproteobacteria bacterium]|nr:F0F1 ATP synthase subunit A [Alphaproteobacteria bacterium]